MYGITPLLPPRGCHSTVLVLRCKVIWGPVAQTHSPSILLANASKFCDTGADLPPPKILTRYHSNFIIRFCPHTNSAPCNGDGRDFCQPPSIIQYLSFHENPAKGGFCSTSIMATHSRCRPCLFHLKDPTSHQLLAHRKSSTFEGNLVLKISL